MGHRRQPLLTKEQTLELDAGLGAEPPFEVCYHSSDDGASVTLAQSDDADAATVAFHAALEELGANGRDGEVVVIKYVPEPRVVLRYRLSDSAWLHDDLAAD